MTGNFFASSKIFSRSPRASASSFIFLIETLIHMRQASKRSISNNLYPFSIQSSSISTDTLVSFFSSYNLCHSKHAARPATSETFFSRDFNCFGHNISATSQAEFSIQTTFLIFFATTTRARRIAAYLHYFLATLVISSLSKAQLFLATPHPERCPAVWASAKISALGILTQPDFYQIHSP